MHGMQDLSSLTGIEPVSPAVVERSFKNSITREVPKYIFISKHL